MFNIDPNDDIDKYSASDFDPWNEQFVRDPLDLWIRFNATPFDKINLQSASNYIIKGWLYRQTLALIYGDAGVSKTFLALDIAVSVALGRNCMNCRVKRGAVIIFMLEGAGTGMNRLVVQQNRIWELIQSGEFDLNGEPVPLIVCSAPIDLCQLNQDAKDIVAFAEKIAGVYEIEVNLIIIDTLFRAMQGGNENDPKDMGKFISNCKTIQDGTGACVLAIHHNGKDKSLGARGHSSLKAAVDTEIIIEKDDNGTFAARLSKQKDGPDNLPFNYKLVQEKLGEDEDGDHITSCYVRQIDGDKHDGQKQSKNGTRDWSKLKGQQKEAMKALWHLINSDQGHLTRNHKKFPDRTPYIEYELWKSECQRMSLGTDPKHFSTYFKRAQTALVEYSWISIYDHKVFLCVTPPEDGI